jgi:3',5'-cyclic AMP phosphodiesterase CpdA
LRTIAHLSDLHFGRVDARLLDPLRRKVAELAPHVVVVSGDLTQRARPEEFRQAREFLDSLPKPQVVVPGNHDVPLYNVFQRFLRPLGRFRRYIGADLEPSYFDDELAVVGINTARSLTFKGGRINEEQVERIRARICTLPDEVTKILVTHHPFDADEENPRHVGQIVGRAAMAMKTLAECGADVLLSGHLHATHTESTAERYRIEGFSALVVQAGTATSTRARGEVNSFNALRVEPRHIAVDEYAWDEGAARFAVKQTRAFRHTPKGWAPALR